MGCQGKLRPARPSQATKGCPGNGTCLQMVITIFSQFSNDRKITINTEVIVYPSPILFRLAVVKETCITTNMHPNFEHYILCFFINQTLLRMKRN